MRRGGMSKGSSIESHTTVSAEKMQYSSQNTLYTHRMRKIKHISYSSKHDTYVLEIEGDDGEKDYAINDADERVYISRKAP